MSNIQQLPDDHPKIKKWNRYKRTHEYENSRKWALIEKHTEGSLWAAFNEGFESGVDIERECLSAEIGRKDAVLRELYSAENYEQLTEMLDDALSAGEGQEIPLTSVYGQYCWDHGENAGGKIGGVWLKDYCPECPPAEQGRDNG